MRLADLALRLLGSSSGDTIVRAAAAASGAIRCRQVTDGGSGPGVVKQPGGERLHCRSCRVAEVAGAAPLAAPSFTGNVTVAGSLTVGVMPIRLDWLQRCCNGMWAPDATGLASRNWGRHPLPRIGNIHRNDVHYFQNTAGTTAMPISTRPAPTTSRLVGVISDAA